MGRGGDGVFGPDVGERGGERPVGLRPVARADDARAVGHHPAHVVRERVVGDHQEAHVEAEVRPVAADRVEAAGGLHPAPLPHAEDDEAARPGQPERVPVGGGRPEGRGALGRGAEPVPEQERAGERRGGLGLVVGDPEAVAPVVLGVGGGLDRRLGVGDRTERVGAGQGVGARAASRQPERPLGRPARRDLDDRPQRDDRVEHGAGRPAQRARRVERGRRRPVPRAADEPEPVGLPRHGLGAIVEPVRQPRRGVLRRARAAPGEEDGPPLDALGLDEQLRERRVRRVGRPVVDDDLGERRRLDAARAPVARRQAEVTDERAARRDGQAQPRLQAVVLPHDLDRPRPEPGLVAVRLWVRPPPRRPDGAGVEVAEEDEEPVGVLDAVGPPAREVGALERDPAGPGRGDGGGRPAPAHQERRRGGAGEVGGGVAGRDGEFHGRGGRARRGGGSSPSRCRA